MNSFRTALLFFVGAALICAAEKPHNWQRAKVIYQKVGSYQAGAYAAPIGTAAIAVPIYRRSNVVVVETDTDRLEWSEAGRSTVILPVNGYIQFYRDGNWFIVVDSNKKKHKFALVGMTVKPQNN
ncbi:MAG: hypothetical protein ACLQBJ_07565 [Bryobacteraceae bacterium]